MQMPKAPSRPEASVRRYVPFGEYSNTERASSSVTSSVREPESTIWMGWVSRASPGMKLLLTSEPSLALSAHTRPSVGPESGMSSRSPDCAEAEAVTRTSAAGICRWRIDLMSMSYPIA